MNKWISIAASAVLVLSLSGCTDGDDGINGTNGVDGINGVDGTDGVDGVVIYDTPTVVEEDDILINANVDRPDFGKLKEDELYINSLKYLGFDGAKKYGFTSNIMRKDVVTPEDAIDLADGLTAKFLTREAANKADLFNFFPAENPTHLIACIEGGVEDLGAGKLNPSVQSWDLETGDVTTILRGMERCDGLRTTSWGTVIATEETTTGQAYEIIDPLNVENHTVTSRELGTIVQADGSTPSDNVVKHDALPTMAWEGLTVLENGVIIAGDELRPGTGTEDADGGSIFKFVPAVPHEGGMINNLSESPLTDGTVYAMQVQCKDGTSQWGQGCEIGNARWIEVNASTARADANDNGATGFYRPEDLHKDPTYEGEGVKFCWANTGNESSEHYGEIICGVDTDTLNAVNDGTTTIINRFVEGNPEFTSVDSVEIHPVTGDVYAIEDHQNGDIWACLKDGADKDIKTDGCVRLLAVKDQSAEPTGFIFSADGSKAYLSIQHSDDTDMPLVDDYRTDDIIVIEGFQKVDPLLDFGKQKEDELYIKSQEYLGFDGAKKDGYTTNVMRKDVETPYDAIDLADGLTATFLTREAANKADLFNFFPAENPTHLIACIEGGDEVIDGASKLNPSVQSWDLATGDVKTILRGMNRCDGIRTTAWGTVLATEETTTGQAYEIIDPLNVENHTVTDRTAGTIVEADGVTPSTNVVKHDALPTMAWEGLTVLDTGVVIGGDELRPGTGTEDADGGAIFKFVPAVPHAGGMITDLSQSPFVNGTVYAMQVQCKDGTSQWGQGCEIGNARWIEVNASTARADANANGATGYYRPEDLHKDPTYEGEGVRFCWANTGNEGAEHYGEIICGVDSDPLNAINDGTTTIVNRFVEGNPEFTSVDSLEINPVTGDVYGIEDHENGDIWACLKDGADKDIKTDGCVRLLSVKDQSAEPTGFIFSPDGSKAYLSIQHSDDTDMPLVDDYNTDDIIVIEGFEFTK